MNVVSMESLLNYSLFPPHFNEIVVGQFLTITQCTSEKCFSHTRLGPGKGSCDLWVVFVASVITDLFLPTHPKNFSWCCSLNCYLFTTILQKCKIGVKWASVNSLAWLIGWSLLPSFLPSLGRKLFYCVIFLMMHDVHVRVCWTCNKGQVVAVSLALLPVVCEKIILNSL